MAIELQPNGQLARYQMEELVVKGEFSPLPESEMWYQKELTTPNYVRFARPDQLDRPLVREWEQNANVFRAQMDEYRSAQGGNQSQNVQIKDTRWPGVRGY